MPQVIYRSPPLYKMQALARMTSPPRGWREQAACSDVDHDMFFDDTRYSEARLVCEGCDVALECLAYSMAPNFIGGIWGGYAPEERSRIRREITKMRAKMGILDG